MFVPKRHGHRGKGGGGGGRDDDINYNDLAGRLAPDTVWPGGPNLSVWPSADGKETLGRGNCLIKLCLKITHFVRSSASGLHKKNRTITARQKR